MRKIRLRGGGVKNGEWKTTNPGEAIAETPDDDKYIKIGDALVTKKDLANTLRNMAKTKASLTMFVYAHAGIPPGEQTWLYNNGDEPSYTTGGRPSTTVYLRRDIPTDSFEFTVRVPLSNGSYNVAAVFMTSESLRSILDSIEGEDAAINEVVRTVGDELSAYLHREMRDSIAAMIREQLAILFRSNPPSLGPRNLSVRVP